MKKNIKAWSEIILTAVMAGTLCACKTGTAAVQETAETTVTEPAEVSVITGGWQINTGDTDINQNEDAKKAFEKATETLTGYEYEPIAVLARQVVSGTNYCILCRGRFVIPDAKDEILLVYVYEDLNGNAEITGIKYLIKMTDTFGSYTANTGDTSIDQNEDVREVFEYVMKDLTGASYEPIAYLGSQIVNGTNYMILCRETIVVPDGETTYALVSIYEDLDGNKEILDIEGIKMGETDEPIEVVNSQIANPFAQYETLEEAEEAAGFELAIPEVKGAVMYYRAMNQEMIEVIVLNEVSGQELYRIRKAEGSDDISGDYNAYSEEKEITMDSRTVTLKGNNGLVYNAVWKDQDDTYALTSNEGMTQEEAETLIAEIH